MAQANATIQQHQPLRVPSGWGAQEKRFISQLEEILDDLYSRFNRIKMTDLGKDLQKTIADGQAAIEVLPDTIRAVVGESSAAGVLNSAIIIDTNGISMTGGHITLSAQSELQMASGGVVNINGASGTINLGTGSMMVATQGTFDTLQVGGTTYYPMIISADQPNETGVLWLKRNDSVVEIVSTEYDTPNEVNRGTADINWSFNQPGGWGSYNNPHVHTSPYAATFISATYIDYTFSYPFLCWQSGNVGAKFWVSIARGNEQIDFQPATLDIPPNQTVWVNMQLTSNVNLFSVSHAGEPFTVTSYMTDHQGVFTFTQAKCKISLTGKAANARPAIQCDLYYIP